MRLSIVIPVYNVAKWLPACLESVLVAANGRAAEIICIDDGSTDASAGILARYPVRTITQANAGYGAAVNAGLDAAKGDFIAIVEADDRVTTVAWDQSLSLLERHADADFARAPYFAERRWRLSKVVGLDAPPAGVFTAYDRPDLLDLPPAIWSGVYRRKSLDSLGLRLPETPGAAFQDTYFSMLLLLSGARAIWADKPFYRYRSDRPGASRDGRRRTDELLHLHNMFLNDLPESARAQSEFADLLYPAYFRRLCWFFEKVSPGYQEEAFRQAYVQFAPVWRDAALSEKIAPRLSPYLRSIFYEFADGRIDAFHRQFGLRPARKPGASFHEDFDLVTALHRDITSLLPSTAIWSTSSAVLWPVSRSIAAALQLRSRFRT